MLGHDLTIARIIIVMSHHHHHHPIFTCPMSVQFLRFFLPIRSMTSYTSLPEFWDLRTSVEGKLLSLGKFQHRSVSQGLSTIDSGYLVLFQLSMHPMRQLDLSLQFLLHRSVDPQGWQRQDAALHRTHRVHGFQHRHLEVFDVILRKKRLCIIMYIETAQKKKRLKNCNILQKSCK